jgi:hypothetical protein
MLGERHNNQLHTRDDFEEDESDYSFSNSYKSRYT